MTGLFCIVLTWLPIREKIIHSIPLGLQSNLAFSVGIFVCTIGLFLSKLVLFSHGFPQGFGSPFTVEASALLLGLFITIVLRHVLRSRHFLAHILSGSAFLVAIVVSCIYCRAHGIYAEAPASLSRTMLSGILQLDWFPFTSVSALTVFLVLFLIDFYGSIDKFIGLTAATNLRSRDSAVEGIEKAMYVDGIGTVGGALLGTTSIITYVESAIGIHAGGRTGIVALVCGLLMLVSLVFMPLVS